MFTLAGIGIGIFGSRAMASEAERVARLQPLSATEVDRGAAGTAALIEGRISRRNRTRFGDYVAYLREEYRGSDSDGDQIWQVDERVTPPILIDAPGGMVQLINDDYNLSGDLHEWRDSNSNFWNGFTNEGTRRYKGFHPGDAVTVIGELAMGREGSGISAEQLYGGSQNDYVEYQRFGARFLPWFGGIFSIVGLIMLFIGVRACIRG
jgi:hypothetical protein